MPDVSVTIPGTTSEEGREAIEAVSRQIIAQVMDFYRARLVQLATELCTTIVWESWMTGEYDD